MDGMEQQPEPTLAEVLRAVNDLATYTTAQFAKVDARLGQLDAAIGTVGAKVDQVRADVAAVKVDTVYTERYLGDAQDAIRRHLSDPDAHGGHAA